MALAVGSVRGAWGWRPIWSPPRMLALSIAFYVFVYTIWLKRRTPQNIVIGGAAGAFPPMIGWAAVTGDVGMLPLLLFAIVFLWTPPHFWALSLYAQRPITDARRRADAAGGGGRAAHPRADPASTRWSLVALSLVPWAARARRAGLWPRGAALGRRLPDRRLARAGATGRSRTAPA